MHRDDSRAKCRLPSRVRYYAGNPAHRYRRRGVGAHLRVGDLGDAWHLSGVARRAGRGIRPNLGGVASEHRAPGDWIALIKGYIKDGGLVLGLAIAVLGFLWIAYLGFAKFNEARQGKAEWAEVGVLGIVGAIVLIFASYLLTEAAGVI